MIHTPLDQPIDGETEIAVPVLGSSPGSIVWDGPLGKAETNV